MKKTFGYVLALIKDNIVSLAGFEFIFKSSALVFFVPLIMQLMNIASDNAGITYITAKNIAHLMRNPVMILMIAAMFLVFTCILYYEVCCLWSCFQNYSHGKKSGVTDMFADGFAHMKKSADGME